MKLSFHCKIKYYLGSIQIFLQKKTVENPLFITNILVFDGFGYDYQAKYAHFDRNERISYDQTLINKATNWQGTIRQLPCRLKPAISGTCLGVCLVKKAALFSNFNHRHFVRTEIIYNFVGPKQWVGANCIALTDQRRRQEEKG